MVVLVVGIATAVIIAGGFFIWLSDPSYKRIKLEKKALQLEVAELKKQLVEKDKQLEAWQPWVPWYVTEKETDGTQE